MAQPIPYTPTTNFADAERDNQGGRSTVSTSGLDAELASLAQTLAGVLTNLALLQRDDGKVRDGYIELYNLSAACRAAIGVEIEPRGLWSTSTVYAVNDLVDVAGAAYLCSTAHTSGVFAVDYAAGKWQVFIDAISTAAGLSFTPPSTMSATNVQAALEELNTQTRNTALPPLAEAYGAL